MNDLDANIVQKVAQQSADCEDRIVALENELIITRLALDNAVNEINRLREHLNRQQIPQSIFVPPFVNSD